MSGQRYDIPLGVDVPNVPLKVAGGNLSLGVSEAINIIDIPLGVDVPNVPLNVADGNISLGVSETINVISGDAYEGDYTITPSAEEQTLPTRNKLMLENVTVGAVEIQPATTTELGAIIVGEDLKITPEGIISVDKATSVQADNTKPITAAAVYTEVGNINALLHTI